MTQHNNNIIINTALQFSDLSTQTTAWTGAVTFPSIASSATTATSTSNQIVLIADNGQRPAYYSTTASQYLYVGTDKPVYTPPSNSPPLTDYIAWYDASSVNLGSSLWTDKSINGNNATIYGSPTLQSGTGNGATATFNALSSNDHTTDAVLFPGELIDNSHYTLFTLSRWNGSNKGWIVGDEGPGSNEEFSSGHRDANSGVAYHNGFVNAYGNWFGDNWVISADSNNFYRPNGSTAKQGTGGSSGGINHFGINYRGIQGYAPSDWQTAEVIIYDRVLSGTEIAATETYLATKYGITLVG